MASWLDSSLQRTSNSNQVTYGDESSSKSISSHTNKHASNSKHHNNNIPAAASFPLTALNLKLLSSATLSEDGSSTRLTKRCRKKRLWRWRPNGLLAHMLHIHKGSQTPQLKDHNHDGMFVIVQALLAVEKTRNFDQKKPFSWDLNDPPPADFN